MQSRMLCAAVLFQVASPLAFAWGPEGHKIVATIAEQRLTPQARAAVEELLGTQTMVDVAMWPDQVRYSLRYAWTNFHCVKLVAGADSFVYSRDCGRGCVVKMLLISINTLENPRASHQARYEALKCLIHFVGDVHTPVHAERAGDKNWFWVNFFGRETDVHTVWDRLIIVRTKKPWESYARELNAAITPAQAAQWSAERDLSQWATESWDIMVKYVRDLPPHNKITDEYCQQALPQIEQRLEMAGVRLAAILNTIFAGEITAEVPAMAG